MLWTWYAFEVMRGIKFSFNMCAKTYKYIRYPPTAQPGTLPTSLAASRPCEIKNCARYGEWRCVIDLLRQVRSFVRGISHYNDQTVMRQYYVYNGNLVPGKIVLMLKEDSGSNTNKHTLTCPGQTFLALAKFSNPCAFRWSKYRSRCPLQCECP